MKTLFCVLLLAATSLPARATTIRVLVQNIYGRREKDCTARYRALAAHILSASPPYDLIALNEHWKVPLDPYYTCDADVLTKAIEADGRYAGAGKSVQHQPSAHGVQVSGGDSIFTLHRITASRSGKFSNSNRFPLSGWLLTRVELAPGLSVDFTDAHFESSGDGCSDACRAKQGAEWAAAIRNFDAGSAGPALLVGDLNTGGPLTSSEKPPYSGNGGYDALMKTLGAPLDVWLSLGKGNGYTYDCANNHAQKCTERERIDYVLLPPPVAAARFALAPVSIDIVRWRTPAGGEISDHFGLDATLEIRPAAVPSPVLAADAAKAAALLPDLAAPPFDGGLPGR